MKLVDVTIHKYKSINEDQSFQLEEDVTVLVGMNESGKTSVLEALAKTNYFNEEGDFSFDKTADYPRRELIRSNRAEKKTGESPKAITCKYELPKSELETFSALRSTEDKPILITTISRYDGSVEYEMENAEVEKREMLSFIFKRFDIESEVPPVEDENKIFETLQSNPNALQEAKALLANPKKYYLMEHLSHELPKFMYFDEYYNLQSKISIEKLLTGKLDDDSDKTARALLELSGLNPEELLKISDNFEEYQALLQATGMEISEFLLKYWNTNDNLSIQFKVELIKRKEKFTVLDTQRRQTQKEITKDIIEHIINVRVLNKKSEVELPLQNRSRGFIWFFSFLIWFKKVQEDQENDYILLLDEPGLNLHASAQRDLLDFINDLTEDYQVVYTTHSPFMVDSKELHKVRTVEETESGTVVSDSIQEKDPKTLFPLQAALGYDIAQNLFISDYNLLVEGVSDMIYLQSMSAILQEAGREGLAEHITIVPTGGLDKVATFISLLRGSDLNIACLLDTPSNRKDHDKFDKTIQQKLIKEKQVRFFHDFLDQDKADIEDLFDKEDYLKLYNATFKEQEDLDSQQLNSEISSILIQIQKATGKNRFNHYRPANELAKQGKEASDFADATLDNFEKVFETVNELLGKE